MKYLLAILTIYNLQFEILTSNTYNLEDPLAAFESLALKVLLHKSLIWKFQENSAPLKHPIANECGYMTFQKNTKHLKKFDHFNNELTKQDLGIFQS